MYCPKCGTQLPENAAFCSACGAGVSQKKEQVIKQSNISFTNQKSNAFSFEVIFLYVINTLCMMLCIFPWVQLKEINIPGVYQTESSTEYNIIDLFITNTDEAISFCRDYLDKDIAFLMPILRIVCLIGIITLIWHVVSLVYLVVKKKDLPLQYVRYAITAIISIIFIVVSLRLNKGDFSAEIAIDPELTWGLSSSVWVDLSHYLSVTKVPLFMALVSVVGFIKCMVDKKKTYKK